MYTTIAVHTVYMVFTCILTSLKTISYTDQCMPPHLPILSLTKQRRCRPLQPGRTISSSSLAPSCQFNDKPRNLYEKRILVSWISQQKKNSLSGIVKTSNLKKLEPKVNSSEYSSISRVRTLISSEWNATMGIESTATKCLAVGVFVRLSPFLFGIMELHILERKRRGEFLQWADRISGHLLGFVGIATVSVGMVLLWKEWTIEHSRHMIHMDWSGILTNFCWTYLASIYLFGLRWKSCRIAKKHSG